jgi:hypothetical protein
MRRASLAVALALLLGGCAGARAPVTDRAPSAGYNYRELQPGRPGVLTGADGVWTVYRSGDRVPPDTNTRRKECDPASDAGARVAPEPGGEACPAPAEPRRTVLLPKP